MMRLFSRCGKYREDLCAVMSGDLSAGERASLENHLETCADCRAFREEIGSFTALLTASKELIPNVEPCQTTQMRWARDFGAEIAPAQPIGARLFRGFLDWSWDLVWPCRRIWGGMVAAWIVIVGLNVSRQATVQTQVARRLSPELMRAFLVHEGLVVAPGRAGEAREPQRIYHERNS